MKPPYRRGLEAAGVAFVITLALGAALLMLTSLSLILDWVGLFFLSAIVGILTGLFACHRAHIHDLQDQLNLLELEVKKLKEIK